MLADCTDENLLLNCSVLGAVSRGVSGGFPAGVLGESGLRNEPFTETLDPGRLGRRDWRVGDVKGARAGICLPLTVLDGVDAMGSSQCSTGQPLPAGAVVQPYLA